MGDMRLVVAGAAGRMGRVLVEIIRQTPGAHLAGAIEQPDSIAIGQDAGLLAGCGQMGVPISGDALATVAGADGILDFTSPQSTVGLAALAAQARIVHVIGTTGLDADHLARLEAAARHAVVVRSGNMSLGVNLLAALVERAARTLGPEYDIEIVEMHHRMKVDAPSGTALAPRRSGGERTWRQTRTAFGSRARRSHRLARNRPYRLCVAARRDRDRGSQSDFRGAGGTSRTRPYRGRSQHFRARRRAGRALGQEPKARPLCDGRCARACRLKFYPAPVQRGVPHDCKTVAASWAGGPASASRSPHILVLAALAKITRITPDSTHPAFSAPYAQEDELLAAHLLADAGLDTEAEARIDRRALRLIDAVRAKSIRFGGVEDLLREYSLSSEEGLALMVLAESLLRVPDDLTADRLIEDKLASPHWSRHAGDSEALLVSAAAWALGVTARVIGKGKTAEGVVAALARRIGMGALRAAARRAVQLMGSHFVFGQTIEDALERACSKDGRLYRYSFDMLGEGARTQADAQRYFASYAEAIEAIGASAGPGSLPERPGISVKLSALHPRYEPLSRPRVQAELVPRVAELARVAKRHDLNFTIDAEEADRLELSLDIVDLLLADPSLASWDGFGLAVQAYQKRALAVIDHVVAAARGHNRRLMLRLVKGAYWDTEIKRAQERGLPDYPVFSRKAMTDLNYLACAKTLLGMRDIVYPQFATHNALTIATIVESAGDIEGFEFQRLHGMGEDLFAALRSEIPKLACRIYAPVGVHENLLAYLVRRLLENGANSSFVARLGDPHVPSANFLSGRRRS